MASSSEGGGASGGGGESNSFRERRLTLAQQADPSAKGAARNRKVSVYDSSSTTAQEGVNFYGSPVSTCGRMSVGGLEPVPGGSTAKINQDRGLAIYPYGTDSDAHARGLFGVFDGHGRIVSTPRRAPQPLGGRPFNRC